MNTQSPERLIKLGDTEQTVSSLDEDIRGHDVKDQDGEDIGKVSDLLIDEAERKVRFIEVASGGFLGIGKETAFIPVDAITGIADGEVHLGHTREHIAAAPVYDPDLVRERQAYTGIIGHYGYNAYWGPGYLYPDYPRYGRL